MREQFSASAARPEQSELVTVAERLAQLQARARIESQRGNDPYMQAFHESFAEALEDPDVADVVGWSLTSRPELGTARALGLSLRAFQAIEMGQDPSYPAGREETENWSPTFTRLLEQPMYTERWWGYMLDDRVSNVARRALVVKLVALFDEPANAVRVLELGTSQTHILQKLMVCDKPRHRFAKTIVVPQLINGQTQALEDMPQSSKLQALLKKKVPFGVSTGIDLNPIDDPATKAWAESCSFYPGERLDPIRRAEYEELSSLRDPRVNFFRGDATNLDNEKFDHEFPHATLYDYALVSFILYQLSKNDIKAVLDTAVSRLDPKGLQKIIVIDSVDELDFEGNAAFQENGWDSANVLVADMREDQPVFKKYLSAENGRFKKIVFEPIIGELAIAKSLDLLAGKKYVPPAPRGRRA